MPRPLKIAAAALAAGLTVTLAPAAQAASPQKTLARAQAAWGPQGTRAELTPLLKDLAAQAPRLHGAERRQARALLARPTSGTADPQRNGWSVPEAPTSPYCTGRFCVHWVDTSSDAPSLADSDGDGVPDYVQAVDAVAENSYFVENVQLGWRAPESDGTLGGDGRTDIYLNQLGGTGIYGYAAPDPGQAISDTDHSRFAYLVVDNDFQRSEFPQYADPIVPLEVTLAHEYNHILQFTYDSLEDTWMFESTAVWMEGKVYPADRDYLQYLRGWTQLTKLPLTSFNGRDPNDRNNVKVYGTSVWNKWLDARLGQDVVRGAWESSLSTRPPSFAVAAYDRSIRVRGGAGFAHEFDRFAAATAEWQAQNSGFPEGALYPDVLRTRSANVDDPGRITSLNHTTYSLVNVRGAGDASSVRLGVRVPAGTRAALALVGRTGGPIGGTSTLTVRELPKGGSGTVTVADPSRFSRLTAVLVNSDAVIKGAAQDTGDFIYAHNRQPFYARVSTDLIGPHVSRFSPRNGARAAARTGRVKVVFDEPVLGVDLDTLRVVASNGRAVPGRVTFTAGTRVATFVPRRPLGQGRHYRVRVGAPITDTTANPLHPESWSFTVAG
ncbi:MAG: hypothetical protein QOC95_1601 [Thermoleophilaceae bacterium]|nr:hypothetical protein [Thermoleophilaceae bacterium]